MMASNNWPPSDSQSPLDNYPPSDNWQPLASGSSVNHQYSSIKSSTIAGNAEVLKDRRFNKGDIQRDLRNI
ncbi:hypothetical protein MA16_Dca005944 [Dendrobium catenatum]|uniref:Uncharacterized protein n=1 Tax=Dendrobium catenatum TaxID=906689 RepID=A0A2I0WJR1_9ASPA|nr:hypothetical protein MA16_Dca005944 [Dendrobium catenatum]